MSQPTSWTSPFNSRSSGDEVLVGIDLAGKVALVTGANTGIGYETARALAARGARVFLACRDHGRGEAALERLLQAHPEAKAEVALLDLASLDSVRALGQGLPAPRLDILVANAGIYGGGYQETAEGFERTVGVCHIGHFLLTHLLLERLKASGAGRVVVVSSESHRQPSTLDFAKLPLSRKQYSDLVAYGQAKLCNVLFANELQRRFSDQGVTAYSLHPGTLVATEIGRSSLLAKVLIQLARPFTKSLAQGAATTVLVATHPELADFGGRYFSDCGLKRSSRESCRPEVAAKLWQLSEGWVGLDS